MFDWRFIAMKTGQEIFDEIEREFEEKKKREHIICPYCNAEQEDMETIYNYVTYWGMDGEKECICDNCAKSFMVKEEVTREFICTKKEDG